MRVFDRKLLRDLWHVRGQALAITAVIACGVAIVVMTFGAMTSLAPLTRAPPDSLGFLSRINEPSLHPSPNIFMVSEDRTVLRGATAVVWDPTVRIGHWVLVAAFAVAYLTGGEALEFHEWAGYVVAAYVACRLVWGFIGSKYARFGDFLYGPRLALTYLRDMVRGRARRYLGHSPAGSFMVFALLIMLAGTVTTGMAELAISHGEGPFSTFLQARSPAPLPEAANYRPPGINEEESTLQEVHEVFANLTLLLIALHIVGVVAASIAHKENLVASMVTGRKKMTPEAGVNQTE